MTGYIAGFILLALLFLLALAGWRGWGSDTRDPDYGVGPVITPPSLRRFPAEVGAGSTKLPRDPARFQPDRNPSGAFS